MFKWIAAKWNQFRINRYLKARRNGQDHAKALRKGLLKPERALEILDNALDHQLANVGTMFFMGGRFRSNMNEDQLTLLMVTIVDLLPALPEAKQKETLDYLRGLRQHNWGCVRNAAINALKGDDDGQAAYVGRTCGTHCDDE